MPPAGKPGSIDFGNGAQTTYAYDGWSERLTAIDTTAPDALNPNPQNRQYIYSPAGDIREIDDLSWVEHYYYSYDKLHRMTSESTSSGSIGVIPGIFNLNYNDPDHIHAVSSVTNKGIDYYDDNGNQLSGPDLTDPQNIVQRNLAFNTDNMPTQVAHPSGGTINLVYDAENTRGKKSGPNGTIYYFS